MAKIKYQSFAIDEFGTVEIVRHPRARRMRLRVAPGMKISVTMPPRIPLYAAKRFVKDHHGWIAEQRKKMAGKQPILDERIEALRSLDKEASKKELKSRLASLARYHGFAYNRVFVKNQKTIWGSCSSKQNINLNIQIAALPKHLQDYVLLHELVHTVVPNHSAKFWAELARVINSPEKLRAELKQYHIVDIDL